MLLDQIGKKLYALELLIEEFKGGFNLHTFRKAGSLLKKLKANKEKEPGAGQ